MAIYRPEHSRSAYRIKLLSSLKVKRKAYIKKAKSQHKLAFKQLNAEMTNLQLQLQRQYLDDQLTRPKP